LQETFISEVNNTEGLNQARDHESARHKLPAEFNKILRPGPKPWKSLNDESILQAVASWNWMHEYFHAYRGTVGIGGYKMSKLLLPLLIVRRISTNVWYASMGHQVFAAICLRLHQFELDGTTHFQFHASHRECEFVYVTEAVDWEAISYIPTRLADHGLAMQQDGDALPLMRHALRQPGHSLTQEDIRKCAENLTLEQSEAITGNFLALAKHFCGTDDGDSDEVKAEVGLYETAYGSVDDIDEQLLADPLFEAVYDDMDDEDKGEWREIGEAKQKRKYRARVRKWETGQGELQQPKRRRLMRPRAKGKAKAAGKAAAKAAAAGPPEPPAAGSQPPAAGPPAAGPPEPPAVPPEPPGPGEPAVPPPPPIPVPPALAAHVRAASFGLTAGWDDIYCNKCRNLAGQKKFSPQPGLRDGETWYMRCFDYVENSWPTRKPGYRAKRQSTMQSAELEIQTWVQSNRSCCSD